MFLLWCTWELCPGKGVQCGDHGMTALVLCQVGTADSLWDLQAQKVWRVEAIVADPI